MYICKYCYDGVHDHEDYKCSNMWLDSVCGCKSIRFIPIKTNRALKLEAFLDEVIGAGNDVAAIQDLKTKAYKLKRT